MKTLFAAIASVVVLGAARPAVMPTSNFQITVTRTTDGWQMHCNRGCAWAEVSLGCRLGDCRALVDSMGISTDVVAKTATHGFAFVLERNGTGWAAKGLAGTLWSKVFWGCPLGRCMAHLDARGVSG